MEPFTPLKVWHYFPMNLFRRHFRRPTSALHAALAQKPIDYAGTSTRQPTASLTRIVRFPCLSSMCICSSGRDRAIFEARILGTVVQNAVAQHVQLRAVPPASCRNQSGL